MDFCLLTGVGSVAELLSAFLIFALVLLATFFTARIVGSFEKQKMTGRNIQIVEMVRLSGGKSIELVKAGDRYLVIGESRDHVGLLCELPPESVMIMETGTGNGMQAPDFKKILEKAGNAFRGKDGK